MRKSFSLTQAESTTPIKATIDVKEFVGLIKQPRQLCYYASWKPVDTAIEILPT
jgi:hypothetical protein